MRYQTTIGQDRYLFLTGTSPCNKVELSMTTKAHHLADTIISDLKRLLSTEMSPGQPEIGIAERLKQNIGAVTCFSDLHDYMDANTLGESERIWEELTADIPPEGDEKKVQAACDVLNEAQTIVDEWIKQGGLTADQIKEEGHERRNPDSSSITLGVNR
jgi:hypothetical protein